jgi:hypothetical protein
MKVTIQNIMYFNVVQLWAFAAHLFPAQKEAMEKIRQKENYWSMKLIQHFSSRKSVLLMYSAAFFPEKYINFYFSHIRQRFFLILLPKIQLLGKSPVP